MSEETEYFRGEAGYTALVLGGKLNKGSKKRLKLLGSRLEKAMQSGKSLNGSLVNLIVSIDLALTDAGKDCASMHEIRQEVKSYSSRLKKADQAPPKDIEELRKISISLARYLSRSS